jgi:hypothetical protein
MSYPDYAQRAHSLSDCSCPLAVAAMKDKIVQRSTVVVLNVIYEEDFSRVLVWVPTQA